jgi:hypothetical protein
MRKLVQALDDGPLSIVEGVIMKTGQFSLDN